MKKQVVGAIVGVLSIMSLGLARLEPPAKHVVDTDKLVAETQKDLPGKDSVGFVWWIPKEFWQACFAEEEDIPQEESDAIVEKIGRYTILMVVDGEINDEMEMTFVAESALRKGLKLIDPSGGTHLPLKDADVDEQTQEVFRTMLPLIEAAAGEMGENMQVFYFEGKSKDGKALIDPTREGFLQVKLGERSVRFRLPLASLMPEKKCPTCAEMLSGSWKFCPWDGASLKAEEKAK